MTKRIAKKRALHGCDGNSTVRVNTWQWGAARDVLDAHPKWEVSLARVDRLWASVERRYRARRGPLWAHLAKTTAGTEVFVGIGAVDDEAAP